jgi:adenylyltransferase and sulfurtransferase
MSSSASSPIDARVEQLERELAACELQLRRLRLDLADARSAQLRASEYEQDRAKHLSLALEGGFPNEWMLEALTALKEQNVDDDDNLQQQQQQKPGWPLLDREYRRYGRQLIMPEIGMPGQLRLKQASVLIVGMGGLGCPAAAYLAGAGVKALGFVDADTVEESNLHRQILHNTKKIGAFKVDSAVDYLRSYVTLFALIWDWYYPCLVFKS